jgi:hypothetical protein
MDAGLLRKIFGQGQQWQGPCTIILSAEASVQTIGSDSIVGSGAKVYAQRLVSGRILADHVCLLQDGSTLVIVQQQKIRQATGEDVLKQTLFVTDAAHVAALEFADVGALTTLGLCTPPGKPSGSHPGVAPRPKSQPVV